MKLETDLVALNKDVIHHTSSVGSVLLGEKGLTQNFFTDWW